MAQAPAQVPAQAQADLLTLVTDLPTLVTTLLVEAVTEEEMGMGIEALVETLAEEQVLITDIKVVISLNLNPIQAQLQLRS
jgi:hypothetical protein